MYRSIVNNYVAPLCEPIEGYGSLHLHEFYGIALRGVQIMYQVLTHPFLWRECHPTLTHYVQHFLLSVTLSYLYIVLWHNLLFVTAFVIVIRLGFLFLAQTVVNLIGKTECDGGRYATHTEFAI